MDSVLQLLERLKQANEVDVFELEMAPGVTTLGWGLKKVVSCLKGQIVQVTLNATYNTNAKDLELYCCMGEYDNVGFPLAYCLLTMMSSITPGKCKITLTSFREAIKNSCKVNPCFMHTDKDIAKIKSGKTIWTLSKHQLYWWHIKKAINTCLKKSKQSTTPYDPSILKHINPDDVEDSEDVLGSSKPPLPSPSAPLPSVSTFVTPLSNPGPNSLHIKTKIPTGYQMPDLPAESKIDSDDDVPESGLHSFCP
ncbi:hypothetical protein M422DRAFT_243557 [Sphaerobolus stellatus SS14]|nr:hypothetical protein M422DRAFT_243557 [Sphaerobolus stellatus SS14]